jgi:pyruvate/2-oxoglutarate dehydrogenase complex dihydrolipoamide acyltransferase (E2) component
VALLIKIEQWSENLEEATVGRWLKSEGDPVAAAESVVEIITDKVTFEWEAEGAGVLRRIVAPEKSVVPVGYCIGIIAAAGEALPDVEAENTQLMATGRELTAGPREVVRKAGVGHITKVRAVPAARRIARERGVDLAAVAETLSEDRPITVADVEAFVGRRDTGDRR